MNFKEWRNLLQQHPDKQIQFWHAGKSIATDYHVTEIKANHWRSIDCGGQSLVGEETSIQLLVPVKLTNHSLKINKILKILDSAEKNFSLPKNLKFEYQPADSALSMYHIQYLGTTEDFVKLELVSEIAVCKPQLRRSLSVENLKPTRGSSPTVERNACC